MIKNIILLISVAAAVCPGGQRPDTPLLKNHSIQRIPLRKNAPVIPDLLIVKQRDGLEKATHSSWLSALDKAGAVSVTPAFPAHTNDGTRLSSIMQVTLSSDADVFRIAEQLMEKPSVEWAEPVYLRKLSYNPDDPGIVNQWHIALMHCPEAWELSRGDTSIVIGIVDTGVERVHPDLQAHIWHNPDEIPDNGLDDDGNGYVDDYYGWDFGDNDADPSPASNSSIPDRFHGTAVAGAAAAVTDNGAGVASPAFSARIMSIKATRESDQDQNVISGYQGIAYAADQGARIVNCSFGGEGASNVERDVVEYAVNKGVIIVAAAGNSGLYGSDYPAAYPHVLSVASTNQSDQRSWFSNYGPDVDVSAPGQSIYTTDIGQDYASVSGTSFSSPVTAGVAALVMAGFPEWTAAQIREQIRVSALPIDSLNGGFEGDIGWGRIDAYRALTVRSPAIRLAGYELGESADADQDGVLSPGETGAVIITIRNFLYASSGIHLTFSADRADVTLENAEIDIPGLAMMETYRNISDPLIIHIGSQVPRGTVLTIGLDIQAGNYTDQDRFSFEIAPPYQTLESGQTALTLTSVGRLGYLDYPDNSKGNGFLFRKIENMLFEGSFMAAVSADSVSDGARGADQSVADADFQTVPGGDVTLLQPGGFADNEMISEFSDENSLNAIGIRVNQKGYAFLDTEAVDFILLKYKLTDVLDPVSNLYAGLFLDWDIGEIGLNAGQNQPGYDPALRMAYIYDHATGLHGGVQVFPGDYPVQYRSIHNSSEIYDGYTDSEKWQHLSGGIQAISQDFPEDYSCVLGAGPIRIASGDTAVLGFALLAGESLDDLKANGLAAMTRWQMLMSGDTVPVPGEIPDTSFVLFPPVPNPFHDETAISWELPETGHVRISVYDILGRLVIRLVDREVEVNPLVVGEPFTVTWTGETRRGVQAASGVYLICLEYLTYRKVHKVIYLQGH